MIDEFLSWRDTVWKIKMDIMASWFQYQNRFIDNKMMKNIRPEEFINFVSDMAEAVFENGGEPDVLIISPKYEYLLDSEGYKGGVKLISVETPASRVQVIVDKYCPPDTFYLVSWKDVDRAYETANELFEWVKIGYA